MEIIVEQVQPSGRGHYRLIPNINRSGRALPDTVSADDLRQNPKTDREAPSRKLRDGQIYSIMVDVSPAEFAAHAALSLEVHFAAGLFRVLDKSGIPLKRQDATPVVIDLVQAKKDNTKARGIQFFLEAQTFWGSALLPKDAPRNLFFRFVDGSKQVLVEQASFKGNDLLTADVILVGDDVPAERIYICDVVENQPSVRDVADAARQAGVPLTVVPQSVNLGDSWLQDQFQLGYTATREGSQEVIVHLPRMVNDAALIPGTPNLRNFVDAYFPSDGIGVVKDFWQLKVAVSDGLNTLELGVAESFVVFKQLVRVIRLLSLMFSLIRKIDKRANPSLPGGDFTDLYLLRIAIDDAYAQLLGYRQVTAEQKSLILALRTAINEISAVLGRTRESVQFTIQTQDGTKQFDFNADNRSALQNFFRAIRDLHSSRNYGGNIEVSPPYADAVYGKIIAGSISSDPLKDFLTSRGSRHPIASVYTNWLDVGHIDEIACFVDRGTGGFAVLRAAPMLAITMLVRAVAYQREGKLVTRLFRGKKWIHEATAGSPDSHPPPSAYAALLGPDGPYGLQGLGTKVDRSEPQPYGHAAFHDDRQFLVFSRRRTVDARYAAFISCADLLAMCRSTNRAADALFLANDFRYADEVAYRPYYDSDAYREEALPFRLDTVLAKEFAGVPVRPVPVLFDRVDDFLHSGTKAIVPDLVNLQTLGRYVLVPRPYGPRMRVADAIALVGEFAERQGGVKLKPDADYIRSRGLDQTWHWTRSAERVHRASIGAWPTDFDADYEEMNRSDALAVAVSTTKYEVLSLYRLLHANDPLANHPVSEPENLYRIAGYFKDGFEEFKNYRGDFCEGDTGKAHPRQDQYEADIQKVMDRIRRANPNVFDNAGNVASRDWVKIDIPEETVDIFELFTQLVLESLGMKVQWVDSWYYHTHSGGIHCGTNVLRSRHGG
ncbi:MAG: protein-arginine deiminase domain-containing protein [Pseudomonadota bacterium]|nr:protein-arginine deiminase domain-containing protein [Pseudomonadota bacterium]